MSSNHVVQAISKGSLGHFIDRCKAVALSVVLVASLGVAAPRPAQALTVMLNFTPSTSTDMFNTTTEAESFSAWGFSSLNLSDIRAAALAGVIDDYLGYPTNAANAFSPLPLGKQLNINFEVSTGLTTPTSGDSDYYYINIGDANPSQGFLGQACLSCVRGGSLSAAGTIVGSVLTDSIFGLTSLASDDDELMNLLIGTISHEIGHTLGLFHPSGPLANPGESAYSLLATGAAPTSMPNGQRILDRDFAYTEFTTLIRTVGLRDVEVTAVPEPASVALLGLALLMLAAIRKRRQA